MDKSPLIQTDVKQGYKLTKAKMSKFQPRAWKLTPFTIPMRDDGIVFFHWRRNCDDTREYPFARFNKHIDNPSYTSVEYDQYLVDPDWTKEETDYFMDLCNQFDTRFVVIQKDPPAENRQNNKASLKFMLDHKRGSLATVLNVLSDCKLNLTKIQSMPVIETPWKYSFFVDITFDEYTHYEKALQVMAIMTESFKVLGTYTNQRN